MVDGHRRASLTAAAESRPALDDQTGIRGAQPAIVPTASLVRSTSPATGPHPGAVDFLAAKVDLVDPSRVGDVLERIGVEHDEVGALPAATIPVLIFATSAASRVAMTIASAGVKPIVTQFSNSSWSYQPKPRPAEPLSLPKTSFMPAADQRLRRVVPSPWSSWRARSTASGVMLLIASPCCS